MWRCPHAARNSGTATARTTPPVLRIGKKFYLYFMGNRDDLAPTKGLNWVHRNNQRIGVAVADSPDGPWQRFDNPLVEPTPGFYDALC